MLLLIGVWGIIFLFAFVLGQARGPKQDYLLNVLMGLSLLTAVAQFYSIYNPIDHSFFFLLGAPVVLASVSIFLSHKWQPSRWSLTQVACLILLVWLALQLCLGQTTNVDEAGYYLPAVRWMESHPVTPGTALLNHRIGFDSSVHMLSAVFGLRSWVEGGVYELNGFFFILFSFYFMSKTLEVIKKREALRPSDWLVMAALVFPFSFLVDSMDADYLSIFGGIYMHYRVLRMMETEVNPKELSTLIFVAIFMTTVRPFNGLYALFPAMMMVRHSGWLKTIGAVGLPTLLLFVPWCVRSYYLTGYVIYPFYFLDFFDPDWKVPLHVAKASHDIIGEFAKLEILRPEYLYDDMTQPTLSEWILPWGQRMWETVLGKIVLITLPLRCYPMPTNCSAYGKLTISGSPPT